ncbi:MAG TPA: hypothetical protein VLB80_00915 [Candidatus Babeliales bacterium]|nr:hypothetical protein [Candidatus Babeliales bacterium]
MNIKHTLLITTIIFCAASNVALANESKEELPSNPSNPMSQNKSGQVFDEGLYTEINGNSLYHYLNNDRSQYNPDTTFKKIEVIEHTKNGTFQKVGTLGSIEKNRMQQQAIDTRTTKKQQISKELRTKFTKHAKMNNAIFCPNVIQRKDYDGNLKNVGVIIYRTQNTDLCDTYKNYLIEMEKEKTAQAAARAIGIEIANKL